MKCILNEIGFPRQFTVWIMFDVTYVSYMFNINGDYSDIMQAKRGLRHDDPFHPFSLSLG